MNLDALKIAKEISEIYENISQPLDLTPTGLIAELDHRCQWLARSSQLEADCQFIHARARGKACELYPKVSATVLKEFLSRDCAEEARLLKLADRLNSTIVHQMDSIRTLISYEKESMRSR